MEDKQSIELASQYNEGVIQLPKPQLGDIPPLNAPKYHPTPEELTKARKLLPLSIILISFVCVFILLLFGFGLIVLLR